MIDRASIKVQDLKEGMVVVNCTGKGGLLTIQSVNPTLTELYPQQYEVRFSELRAAEQFGEDFEFEVLEVS